MDERYRDVEDKYSSKSFQKFPVTIVKGRGAVVWDVNGKEYLDLMGGYGVAIVGHCNPLVVGAIKRQAERLITCHGSFYNDARSEFIERLVKISPSGLDSLILSNSGTEAVEAALKLARRYTGRKNFISMKGGFHGKTLGSLSATWNPRYREPFLPLLPYFEFVDYGSIEQLEEKVNQDTAAVIAEPIQGESGIIIPPHDYFKRVREICDKNGALLILDEIQCGLGRTGKMWASEHWGVTPDIMTVAKGLAGGIPIGATIAKKEIINSLKRGEHTSTFAGNPIACAAGSATIDFITSNNLPELARRKGNAALDMLRRISSSYRVAKEARGMGLMLALEMRIDIYNILLGSMANGALFAYSGKNVVRLLPPLIIEESEIERAINVLEGSVRREEEEHNGQN